MMRNSRISEAGTIGMNFWNESAISDNQRRVMYRQFLDLYATSVDYDPDSAESIAFFKMVQNKLHYAAHGHTAAEGRLLRRNSGLLSDIQSGRSSAITNAE